MAVSEDFQALADAIDRLATAFSSLSPKQESAEELKMREISRRLNLAQMKQQADEQNVDISDLL